MRCSVAGCNCDNQSRDFNKDISFYRFPKDEIICKAWANACERSDKFKPNNGRICSKHFSKDDFERNLKYELLNYSPINRRTLKSSAVPTLLLPNNSVKSCCSEETSNRFGKCFGKFLWCN